MNTILLLALDHPITTFVVLLIAFVIYYKLIYPGETK